MDAFVVIVSERKISLRTHYVSKYDTEFLILLPPPLKCCEPSLSMIAYCLLVWFGCLGI